MAWPQILQRTVTCPSCGATTVVEAIHQPHQRIHASRDRIYKSLTWVDCTTCGAEWEHRDEPNHAPWHAA